MALQIIGSGLARTGTMSLKQALEHLLDTPCFHVIELMKQPKRVSYLKERYKKGTTNWDAFYDGFGVAVDYPTCLYFEELLVKYPNAKVIHTIREPESWYESVYNTVYRGVPKGAKDIFRLIKTSLTSKDMRQLAPVFQHNEKIIWKEQFEGKFEDKSRAIEIFEAHTERVKQIVPSDKLLIFNVKEGWKPLCAFLNKEMPNSPFPRANARSEFNRKMDLGNL